MKNKTYTIESYPTYVEPLEILTGREKRRAKRKQLKNKNHVRRR